MGCNVFICMCMISSVGIQLIEVAFLKMFLNDMHVCSNYRVARFFNRQPFFFDPCSIVPKRLTSLIQNYFVSHKVSGLFCQVVGSYKYNNNISDLFMRFC